MTLVNEHTGLRTPAPTPPENLREYFLFSYLNPRLLSNSTGRAPSLSSPSFIRPGSIHGTTTDAPLRRAPSRCPAQSRYSATNHRKRRLHGAQMPSWCFAKERGMKPRHKRRTLHSRIAALAQKYGRREIGQRLPSWLPRLKVAHRTGGTLDAAYGMWFESLT